MNLEKYISILEKVSILSLKVQFGNSNVIFIDGNALCHNFRTVKNILSKSNFLQLEWYAYNPDVNYKENIGYILKKTVFKHSSQIKPRN